MTCREAQGTPYWGGLAASKGALDAMVLSWAVEHERDQLRVNLFDPGAMLSESRASSGGSLQGARRAEDVVPAMTPLLRRGGTKRGALVSVT